MLPIPAIRVWLSRNDFSGARRSAASSQQGLGGELPVERLDAEPGGEVGVELLPGEDDRRGRTGARR